MCVFVCVYQVTMGQQRSIVITMHTWCVPYSVWHERTLNNFKLFHIQCLGLYVKVDCNWWECDSIKDKIVRIDTLMYRIQAFIKITRTAANRVPFFLFYLVRFLQLLLSVSRYVWVCIVYMIFNCWRHWHFFLVYPLFARCSFQTLRDCMERS